MSNAEKKLVKLLRGLSETDRATLLSFAEFLAARQGPAEPKPVPPPQPIAAKPGESVVGAIKRLSTSYPMLDKGRMLNETSSLMAQYTLQGREAGEVIEELEVVFRRHYERLVAGNEND